MRHFILILAFFSLVPQYCFAEEAARTIQVIGRSIITADAEFADLHAELKVISPSVEESYIGVTQSLTEIAASLQPLGISRENIITSTISQGTEYSWQDGTQTIIGYYSTCALKIKINNISDTFRIHAKLSEFKNLTTGATQYGRNDEPQMRIGALQQALKDAQAKAQVMSETLGAGLGQVLHIREEGETVPFRQERMEAKVAASPVDPGEVTTTGSVTVTGTVAVEFALE